MIHLTEKERLEALEYCDKILANIRVQQQALANIARIADNLAHGRPLTEGLGKKDAE